MLCIQTTSIPLYSEAENSCMVIWCCLSKHRHLREATKQGMIKSNFKSEWCHKGIVSSGEGANCWRLLPLLYFLNSENQQTLGPLAPSPVPGCSTEAENKSFALKFKSMKKISSSVDGEGVPQLIHL